MNKSAEVRRQLIRILIEMCALFVVSTFALVASVTLAEDLLTKFAACTLVGVVLVRALVIAMEANRIAMDDL